MTEEQFKTINDIISAGFTFISLLLFIIILLIILCD